MHGQSSLSSTTSIIIKKKSATELWKEKRKTTNDKDNKINNINVGFTTSSMVHLNFLMLPNYRLKEIFQVLEQALKYR